MLIWLVGGFMSKIFNSSGYIHAGFIESSSGEQLDFSVLPPFLRVLLSTDGTVTKSLESFFWEPVKVDAVEQKLVTLSSELPALDLNQGDAVLSRKVELVGDNSKKIYSYADSYICVDKLPDFIARSIIEGDIGIGELLRERGLETYREIIDFGIRFRGQDKESVWRSYLIMHEKQAIISITEYFPLSIYSS